MPNKKFYYKKKALKLAPESDSTVLLWNPSFSSRSHVYGARLSSSTAPITRPCCLRLAVVAASAAVMAAALPKSKTSAAMGKKHIHYPITQSFHDQVLVTFKKNIAYVFHKYLMDIWLRVHVFRRSPQPRTEHAGRRPCPGWKPIPVT